MTETKKPKRTRKVDKDKPMNPFVINNRIPTYRKNDVTRTAVLNSLPTGDSIVVAPEIYGITKSFIVDAQSSYKVYKGNVPFLLTLSKNALLMVCIIPDRLKWNQDLIAISITEYAQLLEVTTSTITNSINDLIDNNFLLRYKKGYYWINPFRFFHGDRLVAYSNNLQLAGE